MDIYEVWIAKDKSESTLFCASEKNKEAYNKLIRTVYNKPMELLASFETDNYKDASIIYKDVMGF